MKPAPECVMEEQRHQLSDIINFLPDATWAVDVSGAVIAWNKTAEELTGVKSQDIIGRNNFEYAVSFYGERMPILVDVAIRPNPEQESRYESFRRRGDTVEAELFVPCLRPGGAYLWATARRLYNKSGTMVGAIETIRDITERKHLTEVMMQAEKMTTIGGLAAGMAHELNNPLGSILQNIQNIQRRVSDELPANEKLADEIGVPLSQVRSYLHQRGIIDLMDIIARSGVRAANIIAMMQAFTGNKTTVFEATDTNDLVDHAHNLALCDYDLENKYQFSNIKIVREFDRNMPKVVVSRPEIEQALLNVIKNAAQALYSHAGNMAPCISLKTFHEAGHACIVIEDNGPGMSPEVSRRIFEPFFTTNDVGIGAGLGLSVAYALIVNNHKGIINVNSRPGHGSTIKVCLPLHTNEECGTVTDSRRDSNSLFQT